MHIKAAVAAGVLLLLLLLQRHGLQCAFQCVICYVVALAVLYLFCHSLQAACSIHVSMLAVPMLRNHSILITATTEMHVCCC
jgi:hypothetical protein